MKLSSSLAVLVLALAASSPAAAAISAYTTTLSGAAEAEPNNSPGSGTALISVDDVTQQIRIRATFQDLVGGTTAAHIHCCTDAPDTGTAGVATQTPTFVGFPAAVTSGSYDMTFSLNDTSFYNAAFITAQGGLSAARETFVDNLGTGRAYFNIHSTEFPGGEIRGFLKPVPEPGTYALMLAGLAALGACVRRRR